MTRAYRQLLREACLYASLSADLDAVDLPTSTGGVQLIALAVEAIGTFGSGRTPLEAGLRNSSGPARTDRAPLRHVRGRRAGAVTAAEAISAE